MGVNNKVYPHRVEGWRVLVRKDNNTHVAVVFAEDGTIEYMKAFAVVMRADGTYNKETCLVFADILSACGSAPVHIQKNG